MKGRSLTESPSFVPNSSSFSSLEPPPWSFISHLLRKSMKPLLAQNQRSCPPGLSTFQSDCGSLNNAQRDAHIQIPGTYQCYPIWPKRTLQMRLKSLTWGDYPGLWGWALKCNTHTLIRGWQKEFTPQTRGRPCDHRGRDRNHSQEPPLTTTRAWKRQEMHSTLEPLEGGWPCWHLHFSPVILNSDFHPPEQWQNKLLLF